MCVKQYNLDDYANIEESLTYELSEEILKIIENLSVDVDELKHYCYQMIIMMIKEKSS